jgi:hypothetical protein
LLLRFHSNPIHPGSNAHIQLLKNRC